MITERLFCVKPDLDTTFLDPATAAHPEVYAKWEEEHNDNRDRKYLTVCPADEVCHRLKEIHAKEAGHESNGHKEGCDDRQRFHNVVHAVVDNG